MFIIVSTTEEYQMNKKLIAAAVSSALALPAVASAAESEVSVYGRINNAVQYTDREGADNVWGLRNVVSRIGMRAKSDLGNGLSAIGRYEFFTYTNREGDLDNVTALGTPGGKGRGGINDTRLGYVGLSGAWGAITVGNQWSSFYDVVGTYLDPTYSVGYFLYSSAMGGPYRSSNTIKYANSFGPVYLEFDVRMSQNDLTGTNNPPAGSVNADEEVLGRDCGTQCAADGFGLGLSYNIGDSLTLAAAYDKDQKDLSPDDAERVGLAAKYSSGAWWASLSWYQLDNTAAQKTDQLQAWVGTTFGNTSVMAGYGRADLNETGGGKPTQFTLGIYHNMGGGFRLYYEGAFTDAKTSSMFDGNVSLFGMRYDFST